MKLHWLLFAVAYAAFGAWRGGIFSAKPATPSQRAFACRSFAWALSLVIVAWPLRRFRPALGDTGYIVAALAILLLFYAVGSGLARKVQEKQRVTGGSAGGA